MLSGRAKSILCRGTSDGFQSVSVCSRSGETGALTTFTTQHFDAPCHTVHCLILKYCGEY